MHTLTIERFFWLFYAHTIPFARLLSFTRSFSSFYYVAVLVYDTYILRKINIIIRLSSNKHVIFFLPIHTHIIYISIFHEQCQCILLDITYNRINTQAQTHSRAFARDKFQGLRLVSHRLHRTYTLFHMYE